MDIDFWIATFAFIIAIVLLVVSHELGHYVAARILKIKVETFSIGFGPKIFKWQRQNNTEFALSLIPLGGYVKLKQTPWNAVSLTEDEKRHAFNLQPLWKRSIVILMGPCFSILFAVFLFMIIFLVGYTAPKAKIGHVYPDSPAALAGLKKNDLIININQARINHWPQALLHLLKIIGEDKELIINTERQQKENLPAHILSIKQETDKFFQPDKDYLGTLGMVPWQPESPPAILTYVSFGSPAYKAGLKIGDQILKINQTAINHYQHFVNLIKRNPETPLHLEVLRNNHIIHIEMTPKKKYKLFFTFYYGFAGVEGPKPIWPSETQSFEHYSIFKVWGPALQLTWDYLVLMCILMFKLITGTISFFHLAGPLSIAHFAGLALEQGVINFLFFVAIFSINLGIINMLPIPGLDGGHLLFYTIEWLFKKPINPALQDMLIKWAIGASIILLGHVLSNDLTRLAQSFESFHH